MTESIIPFCGEILKIYDQLICLKYFVIHLIKHNRLRKAKALIDLHLGITIRNIGLNIS